MNVYVPTSVKPPTVARRFRARPSPSRRPLLWMTGVLAAAMVLFTAVLIAARLMSQDAVALEPRTPEPDPFYRQKADATAQELPAQF